MAMQQNTDSANSLWISCYPVETTPQAGHASHLKRTVTPRRRRNGDLRTREYLTEAEVERLIAATKRNRHGHRDATMIIVAYRHGLRVAELVDLRWDQGPQTAATSRIASFLSGLDAGGLPSEKVTMVPRITGGDRTLLGPMAADLAVNKVDLIWAIGPAAAQAAHTATTIIPIVSGDLESGPLSTGFIGAIRRPGANVTGVYLDFPDFSKKWLQALKEAVPQISSVGVLWDTATGPHQRRAIEEAAAQLGLNVTVLEVHARDDFDRVLQSAVRQKVSGLVALSSPSIGGNTKQLADLSLKYRLPAVTLYPEFPRDGGLMAYGPNIQAVTRQVGVIAAKILLRASAAETPIETPVRFEFVLNLKTAKSLGIVIPASTLLRADEVIE